MSPIENLLANYPKSVVEKKSSQEGYQGLRVVLLLIRHSSESEKIQNFFNLKVVESLYSSNDSIYVEESRSLKNEQLKASQIFSPKNYRLKGWDHSEICEEATLLKEKLNSVLNIINKFSSFRALSNEEKIFLENFCLENCLTIPSQNEMDNNFLILKTFTNHCLKAVHQIRDEYIAKTFSQRQNRLISKLIKLLAKKNHKIFLLLGESHANTSPTSRYHKDAKNLKNAITNVPYLILNANMEKQAILKSLSDKPISESFLSKAIIQLEAYKNWEVGKIINSINNFCSYYFSMLPSIAFLTKANYLQEAANHVVLRVFSLNYTV